MNQAGGTSPKDGSAAETRTLARFGSISFLGALLSALMGFVLTFAVTRSFGEFGAGIVLQSIGIFSIALGLGKCGMDSVAIWLMPRLSSSNPDQVRAASTFIVVIAAAAGVVGAVVLALIAPAVGGTSTPELTSALRTSAWFLPCATVMVSALGATRGLGAVLPYVIVTNVIVPTLRPTAVIVVAALGGTAVLAVGGWAVPVVLGMIAALIVLARQTRALELPGQPRLWWPRAELRGSIIRFALPRTISVGLEQAVLWLDVVIVGLLAGTAASGIYGGASRLIAAGFIVDTAIRVVVSPRFSAFLHEGRSDQLQHLYRVAAMWLVLLSTPIYLTIGVFAPVVLSWLGPGFVTGANALLILAIGSVITIMAGNIHSVLLMSGHSGWAAVNKMVALTVNVVGNLLLVPWLGINGAAIAWTASILIDAAMATVEVRFLVGVKIAPRSVGYALLIPVLTAGVPAIALQAVLGRDSLLALVLTVIVGGILLLLWCYLDRARLHLDQFLRRPAARG